MNKLKAGIIDVFGEAPLSGNPLAVVEDADALTDAQMQAIAREFNQAETTFLLRSANADWRLRSFTASGTEVFGAGHNALGAWLWLAYRGRLGPLAEPTTFHQAIGANILPITLERRGTFIHGRMRQAPLKLLQVLADTRLLATALGVGEDALQRTPAPRVADTGSNHLLVRFADAAAVDRARPEHDKLLPVLRDVGAEGCYVYAYDEAAPGHAYARFFNPTVGLWEDAATGTAAGPLCGYLGSAGLLGPDRSLRVEQGVRMGRRSVLDVRLTPDPELSGTGVVVLEGEILPAAEVTDRPGHEIPMGGGAMNSIDEAHLLRAIELARLARNTGDAPFGSLLVDEHGAIVMEAHNTELTEGEISAHPEFKIACWAARQMSADAAAKATLFTSCQPCEMCCGAIDRSGIGRVVYALSAAQLNHIRGHAGRPRVPQFGPYLPEAAASPVRDYYQAR